VQATKVAYDIKLVPSKPSLEGWEKEKASLPTYILPWLCMEDWEKATGHSFTGMY